MAKVNADLYEFLQNTAQETGMWKENEKVIAYVHIQFDYLAEFSQIVGCGVFDEGGIDVKMFSDTICIELNDIFEWDDNEILDYKNCFSTDDIEKYWRELNA